MSFLIDIWYMYGDMALVFVMLIAFIFAIYFAIVPHEVAHGLVAKWNGDLTAQTYDESDVAFRPYRICDAGHHGIRLRKTGTRQSV